MKTSEEINELVSAMVKFQKQVESPKKSANNPAFKKDGKAMKYADLDAIIKVITPALSEHGLSQMQFTSSDIDLKTVTITTMLVHSSGQYMTSDPLILPAENFGKFNAQTIGSSITYGRRYSLSAMLGIASEDDDDANGQSLKDDKQQPNPSQQQQQQQQQKQQPPERSNYDIREEELIAELENKVQSLANKTGMEVVALQKFIVDSVNKDRGSTYTQFNQVDKSLAIGTLKMVEMKFDEKQRNKAAEQQSTEQGSILNNGTTTASQSGVDWGRN